jgi:hypothetical protein
MFSIQNAFLHISAPSKACLTLISLLGISGVTHAQFTITLNYINAPTASQQTAFNSAKATWEQIITGYQEGALMGLTIDVNLSYIDGVGGTLGSAGPTSGVITTNFLYVTDGAMTFDTSDSDDLEINGIFDDVILHEMGHVIGIGTVWSASAVTGGSVTGRQELYVAGSGQYTGAYGLAAYNSEFSQNGTFVPVELGGGPGTAGGHWNEVDGGAGATGIVSNITGMDFQFELMTGWLNTSQEPFISNLTIESMRDLGYNVISVVPEPSTAILLSLGCVALIRRKRH